MSRKIIKFLILTCFLIASPGFAERDRIIIDDPSLQKIPIAIPLFKVEPHHPEVARRTSAIASDALEFTGFFKILDPESFLENPQTIDITGTRINFRNWTAVGAELLITGGIWIKNNQIEMELRLFDTLKGQSLVGKRYKGWPNDQQRMIRRFCSEVIYYLTGTRGVFDSRIAFVSNGSGNKEIYICDFDGQNVGRFTYNNAITLFPAWSYDGKWLAYTSYKRGKPDIYIRHLKENRGFVIAKKGLNITPAWVPGAFRLAATLSYEGSQNIYMLSGRGGEVKRLTRNWGIDTSPTWSPDGKKMAFVSNRSGTPQIHVMDLGSGRVDRLTFQGKYNTQPSWSPIGDKVAYSSRGKNGRHNICVISTEGGGPRKLTNVGNNESPSWSPDGSMIAFSSTRGGPSRIYVMNASGAEQRRLIALPGEQTDPEWSPAGVD